MTSSKQDPWVEVRTEHGFPADQVISALQKEIRRGRTENAVLLAYEMLLTGPELERYLWYRLMAIAVEDIGFGEPQAPVLIHALFEMLEVLGPEAPERKLFAVHAVRYLCRSQKDRSSDEMAIWVSRVVAKGRSLPTIPDYALDMHTAAGQEMGRGYRHFLDEGAQLHPELPARDLTYHRRIREMLNAGEL